MSKNKTSETIASVDLPRFLEKGVSVKDLEKEYPNLITKNKQAYYEEYYYTYGTSFSWDVPVEMGKTYEDIVLEETLTFAKEVFLLSEYALENGLDLPIMNPNSATMISAVRAFRVLKGFDVGAADYISSFSVETKKEENKKEITLGEAIEKGLKTF